jgi:hypothetical protein
LKHIATGSFEEAFALKRKGKQRQNLFPKMQVNMTALTQIERKKLTAAGSTSVIAHLLCKTYVFCTICSNYKLRFALFHPKKGKKKESTNQNITINVFLHDLQQKKIQSKKKAHNYPHFRQ